jgi:hypothetical protein
MKEHVLPAALLTLCACFPANAQDEWTFHAIDDFQGRQMIHRGPNSQGGADGIRLADINGDKLMDMIVGWEQSEMVRIYIHPGYERVRKVWPSVEIQPAASLEDANFGDMDSDGVVDALSAGDATAPGTGINIHFAPSDPASYMDSEKWETVIPVDSQIRKSWLQVVPMQADGRHGLDILAGGKETSLFWFEAPENPRDAKGWKRHVLSNAAIEGGWTMTVLPVDINRDGLDDILWTTRKAGVGAVMWLENPGPGEEQKQPWKEHRISDANYDKEMSQGSHGYAFADIADLDGDGYMDVLSGTAGDMIWLYRNPGKSGGKWKACHPELGLHKGFGYGTAFGDINQDGQLDIGLSSAGRPYVDERGGFPDAGGSQAPSRGTRGPGGPRQRVQRAIRDAFKTDPG